MTTTEDRGARKTREGIVVSDKMDKTVPKQTTEEDRSNVIDLKRLAGL